MSEEKKKEEKPVLRTIPGTERTKALFLATFENSKKLSDGMKEHAKKLEEALRAIEAEKSRFWAETNVELGIFGGDYTYDVDNNLVHVHRE